MQMHETDPKYVISIAARIIGIETHTLRYYEKLGLVQPYRSGGNIRYYSEQDIVQLRRVKTLISDLGINIAGVEVIIRMTQRICELQQQVKALDAELHRMRKTPTSGKEKMQKGEKTNE